MSYCLTEQGVDHVVLDRNRPGYDWRERRWDSFCLVTPNWQCQLPGFPYAGPDPDGFMVRDEIADYLERYAVSFGPPLVSGTEVSRLRRRRDGVFELTSPAGDLTADQVVVATGPYQLPAIPPAGQRLPDGIEQLHSSQYRQPWQLPPGAVLVVGTGQSGCQIAEDLHLAGRQVHLAVGSAPRVARRYRGRDVVAWLDDMGYYDKGIDEFADADERPAAGQPLRDRAGRRPRHRPAGVRPGRHAAVRPAGAASTAGGSSFADDLAANLDHADEVSESIKDSVDTFIDATGADAPSEARYTPVWTPPSGPGQLDLERAGVSAVIWSTGFGRDYRWIDVPVFDGRGYPTHDRGVTNCPGLYFLGLPWLHTWGSGRFSGVARDAWHLADQVISYRHRKWGDDLRWIAGSPAETYPDRDWSIPRTAVS